MLLEHENCIQMLPETNHSSIVEYYVNFRCRAERGIHLRPCARVCDGFIFLSTQLKNTQNIPRQHIIVERQAMSVLKKKITNE